MVRRTAANRVYIVVLALATVLATVPAGWAGPTDPGDGSFATVEDAVAVDEEAILDERAELLDALASGSAQPWASRAELASLAQRVHAQLGDPMVAGTVPAEVPTAIAAEPDADRGAPSEGLAWLGAQAERNLALRDELPVPDGPELDPRAAAGHHASVAEVVGSWQAATLDADDVETRSLAGHERPSEALLALADRHDASPSAADRAEVRELDRLPAPVPGALARYVHAFLALHDAASAAYASLEADRLAAAADGDVSRSPGEALARAGVDVGPLLATRAELLDAAAELEAALDRAPLGGGDCDPVQLAPAFSLATGTCDDTYTADYALQFDAGGDDTYHNNAGGSNLAGGCPELPIPPAVPPLVGDPSSGSAALVDLAGDDAYGDPAEPRRCGANGGGYAGVGLLVDEAGNDTYNASHFGTNGGGSFGGLGFLLDRGGQDTYRTGVVGTNGAGGIVGVGTLVDRGAADDTYEAVEVGVNGGAVLGSVGLLVDEGGQETYDTGFGATNGGASAYAVGLLLDRGQADDTYHAGTAATNGGSQVALGSLIDEGGDDTYRAGAAATNGAALFDRSLGLLVDESGNDTYEATTLATNGGGSMGGVGVLHDESGNDTYTATSYGANGGGDVAAVGTLVDRAGDDTYTATDVATNGGGNFGALGALVDRAGDDVYRAGSCGANGGAPTLECLSIPLADGDPPTGGLLFDEEGRDRYVDALVDCEDCSMAPKGLAGVQADGDDLPP